MSGLFTVKLGPVELAALADCFIFIFCSRHKSCVPVGLAWKVLAWQNGRDWCFNPDLGVGPIMKIFLTTALCALLTVGTAQANVIGFEGLTPDFDTFNGLGIANTYQGYTWTASNTAQPPALWGVAEGTLGGLSANSGTGYAWTFNGGQSMFIDFGAATDVVDVFVAGQFSGNEATSIELFGYDAGNALVSQTAATALSVGMWSQIAANLNGINRLEFRSNAPTSWFGIDDLQVNPSSTVDLPEPSTLALVALASLGLLGRRRKGRLAGLWRS